MTAAPAAAPASAPVAPPPARAASQPSADRFAFAAVLDTLPSVTAKTANPTAEEQAHRPGDSPQEESPRGQMTRHSLPNDSALMASLPFAVRAAAMINELSQAADHSPSASPAIKTSKPEGGAASVAAGAKEATVGRLIGERAFHFGATASRTLAVNTALTPAGASAASLTPEADFNGDGASFAGLSPTTPAPATSSTDAVPPIANAMAPAPIASPKSAPSSSNRASLTRTPPHEAARSIKAVGPAQAPAVRASGSTEPPAPSGSNAKAADGRRPDPALSTAPSTSPSSPFGAELSASFVGGASFEPDVSTAGATAVDMAPRASSAVASPASAAQPVKEIDVDLSPGGLEDVSMTMRLAGDRLSVVIHAASSQTLGSIEGARDAITDRLAAIGQTLDSLVVKQTGVHADGNGNASSGDGGSAGSEHESTQGATEWGGSNDALSRRGAGRDRNF